ncbi:MAG: hypothetical protein ACKOEO_13320 [Planctomycetaceae bacterium]
MVMAVETGHGGGLEADLQRALKSLPVVDLSVRLSGGQLQICGTADTWYEKQRAQEMVRRLCPEVRIRNAMRVVNGEQRPSVVQS